MTPERHAQIKRLFLDACALPADKRDAYLDHVCGADAELHRAVADLLLRHTAASTKGAGATAEPQGGADAGAPREAYELPSGAIVAERYRIVSKLGSGGMGVVYRADDLRLDQQVALKFLPPALSRDVLLRRLLEREVRAARMVTHPNVCRVHDLVDADGQTFITMEYVDGEDLKSLLRRIGRMPVERAIQIAQQMCQALATIHRAGLIHRDLKPANVMLDAGGRVRITDFGIAGTRREQLALGAGTPAYMAPEQLMGGPATVASDIYALGQTLYELFTGAPAFDAESLPELAEEKTASRLKRPSQLVGEIPANVERVLLSCLDPNPAHRPSSALAVGAAIAGGDMLMLAIAAGELPSPELVAAAGESSGVPRWLPRAALVACALLLVGLLLIAPRVHPVVSGAFPKSVEALAERARMLAAEDVEVRRQVDEAYGLSSAEHLAISPQTILTEGGTDAAVFWYRSADRRLVPVDGINLAFRGGAVTPTDPPRDPGEHFIVLDGQGRALGAASGGTASPRAAAGPDSLGWRTARVDGARSLVLTVLLVASAPIAVVNLRRGRSDRRGAARLAFVALGLCVLAWLLRARFAVEIDALRRTAALGLAGALLQSTLLWLAYVALEPYVRRFWPQTLISWTRVLDGRVRDALVGLHVLLGVVLGLAIALLVGLDSLLPVWLGLEARPVVRLVDIFDPLTSGFSLGAHVVRTVWQSIYNALFLLLLVVLCRAVLRHSLWALLVATLVFAATFVPLGANPYTAAVCFAVATALGVWALTRLGPVTVATALLVSQLCIQLPITLDLRRWYAGYGAAAIVIPLALAVVGFVLARQGGERTSPERRRVSPRAAIP